MVLPLPPPQHANICATLYEWMAGPLTTLAAALLDFGARAHGREGGERVAVEAARRGYVEAMCEESSSDLLCWAMEKGLGQGGAHAEQLHLCVHRVLTESAVHG